MSFPMSLHSTPEGSTPNSEGAQIEESVTSAGSSIGELATTEDLQELSYHLNLLNPTHTDTERQELISAPVFTHSVKQYAESITHNGTERPFPQYGLIGGIIDVDTKRTDSRVFYNVAAPTSTFICGSQGSGKSHTLSCLLENALAQNIANKLPNPLAGLVFHYDTFISDDGGSPCEAAFLSSHPNISVRVFCAPTNVATIKRTYHNFNIEIVPLTIHQEDLNTKRIMDLMAVRQNDDSVPLYVHVIHRILREMRMQQQERGTRFDYKLFKDMLLATSLTAAQLGPLQQRLDNLESFLPKTADPPSKSSGKKRQKPARNTWLPKPGCLTIVDLSCPCINAEAACSLFNICLSIFLEQTTSVGKIVALDEAHKYMNSSAEASVLTDTLITTIRLQRHLGARVVISTQEPTISPVLMDLSSITIVHRFTSPAWMEALKGHISAVSSLQPDTQIDSNDGEVTCDSQISTPNQVLRATFKDIVTLKTGEALLFSPSAVMSIKDVDRVRFLQSLGGGRVKLRIRKRITTDGGQSVMAL